MKSKTKFILVLMARLMSVTVFCAHANGDERELICTAYVYPAKEAIAMFGPEEALAKTLSEDVKSAIRSGAIAHIRVDHFEDPSKDENNLHLVSTNISSVVQDERCTSAGNCRNVKLTTSLHSGLSYSVGASNLKYRLLWGNYGSDEEKLRLQDMHRLLTTCANAPLEQEVFVSVANTVTQPKILKELIRDVSLVKIYKPAQKSYRYVDAIKLISPYKKEAPIRVEDASSVR